jgi:hypothetical protein
MQCGASEVAVLYMAGATPYRGRLEAAAEGVAMADNVFGTWLSAGSGR